VALSNYPDIIEMGDAFDLRSDEWELGKKLGQAKSEQKATESKEETDTQPETPEMPGETTVETIDDGERNLLQESEAQEPEKEPTDNTPKTSPPVEAFNAIQQLQQLADERKKLAAIHPDNTRFSNDVLAIEYAVSILEAVC
jgi:hypothetical protein